MKEANLNLCKYEDNLLHYKDPKFINEKNILLNEDIYMALDWTKINNLFYDRGAFCEKTNTVGYHWFNGSSKTKEYLKEITNYNIPKIFKGVLFNERNKFNKQLSKITYFDIQIDNWAKFYKNKLNIYIKIINILTKNKPFDFESINIRDYNSHSEMPKFNYIDNNLTIFDELSYAYLLIFYTYANRENKLKIEHFIKNYKYICFFCEIFKSDKLQTNGNMVCNQDFAVLFFKNAYKILLSNTKNINYLYKHNIYNNIIYFPPIGYSEIIKKNLIENKHENIDILFYGNINNSFYYRNNIIEEVEHFSKAKKYNFISVSDLHDDEKDKILINTKIVIHIPSHAKLHGFPWAKTTELMNKKVFFIIEENEEMYIQGLDKLCVFYNRNDINDLQQKIDYYLSNKLERDIIVNKCYDYFKTKYNMDNLFRDILNDY
tara:strand:- start:1586 stop:2884 length:1299 start_codon:yes stop_codon:yes gene_type:complete